MVEYLEVTDGEDEWSVDVCDCLDWLKSMPDKSVDLIITSPPYEAARAYGVGFKLKGQDWVDWAVERYVECVRVCRGLVAWVVEGQTRKFRYSAAPALLMADLHRKGIKLRKPPAFCRVGIPGSGGPDWLRNDYEQIICASDGRLPWSDNTACGSVPKYAPGGEFSHRMRNGKRVNDKMVYEITSTSGYKGGDTESVKKKKYTPPQKANPGNLIRGVVGGGKMGSKLAHDNEAPFPEWLVEFFVKSFCPPGGMVCDPMVGSGTSLSVAVRLGRKGIGCDNRESQKTLTQKRMAEMYERSNLGV